MKGIYTAAICSVFFLASCTGMNRDQTEAVNGAETAASIGHYTEAVFTGNAKGSKLGDIITKEMDKYDREQLNHVYERGVSGQTSFWVNPDRGNQFQITPQPAYTNTEKQWCRKAEVTAIISGKTEKNYTTACRDKNGHWQLK